jgi:hypothetical protein
VEEDKLTKTLKEGDKETIHTLTIKTLTDEKLVTETEAGKTTEFKKATPAKLPPVEQLLVGKWKYEKKAGDKVVESMTLEFTKDKVMGKWKKEDGKDLTWEGNYKVVDVNTLKWAKPSAPKEEEEVHIESINYNQMVLTGGEAKFNKAAFSKTTK